MPTAQVNGAELYYEVRGAGPPMLMLHGGLGLDHIYLKSSLTPLEQRNSLIYYDQRGNGRSDGVPVSTITMEQLADDAAGLLDALGHASVIVFGHSYGGFVAQEMAIRHADRVRALVLCDTTPGELGATESPSDEQGPPLPEAAVELMSSVPERDDELSEMMASMLGLIYLHKRPADEVAWIMEGTQFRAAALVRGFEVLSQWSSVDRLNQITAPTLLLWGRHDMVCSAPQATRIASRIRGSQLAMFEESGHMPWLEEPDAFFTTLEQWLQAHT